jgi:DNA polymerase
LQSFSPESKPGAQETLFIDIETFSDVDLARCGARPYAESKLFRVLLLGWALGDGPAQVVDLELGERPPAWLEKALTDPSVVKAAHNASFELACLSRVFPGVDESQWICTASHAAAAGLPRSLGMAATAAGAEARKMAEGSRLIQLFCKPCEPSLLNDLSERNLPRHYPGQWKLFKDYCARDVEVERWLKKWLDERFPQPESEIALWRLDQRINSRGVAVDLELARNAARIASAQAAKLKNAARALSGLKNPNSPAQLKPWLEEKTGLALESVDKKALADLAGATRSEDAKKMIGVRLEAAKASVTKYKAILDYMCEDGRARGLLLFCGAARTGRWAGRGPQAHNMPKLRIPDAEAEAAIAILRRGDAELLETLFGPPLDTLSRLVRAAFTPGPGCSLVAADFSAIEARVISWLAGEAWRMDVFKTHGKIYEAAASRMFGAPLESIGKESPLRQKGKAAELALGFGGGAGALESQDALAMGLAPEELPKIVSAWRKANPQIVKFWRDMENAARKQIQGGGPTILQRGLAVGGDGRGAMLIKLPSGRRLRYPDARMGTGDRGRSEIRYRNSNGQEAGTYGGKLAENVVQAIARDCLAETMSALDAEGLRIVLHVHDEVVLECPSEQAGAALAKCLEIMGKAPAWAPGLPLRAAGFVSSHYK